MVSGKMKLVAFTTDILLSHVFLTVVYLGGKKGRCLGINTCSFLIPKSSCALKDIEEMLYYLQLSGRMALLTTQLSKWPPPNQFRLFQVTWEIERDILKSHSRFAFSLLKYFNEKLFWDRIGSHCISDWPAQLLLCGPSWPQPHRNLPAFVSWVLALKGWLISFLPVGYCITWFRSHSHWSPNSSCDGTYVTILQLYAFHNESVLNVPFSTLFCLHLLLLTESWKMSFLYHLAPTQKLSEHQGACFSLYLSGIPTL